MRFPHPPSDLRRSSPSQRRRPLAWKPRLEALEERALPSTLFIDASGNASYAAGAGVANHLSLSVSGSTYTFHDTAETIAVSGPGSGGSTGSGTNTVTCPASDLSSMAVDLGDQKDGFVLGSTGVPVTVNDT